MNMILDCRISNDSQLLGDCMQYYLSSQYEHSFYVYTSHPLLAKILAKIPDINALKLS